MGKDKSAGDAPPGCGIARIGFRPTRRRCRAISGGIDSLDLLQRRSGNSVHGPRLRSLSHRSELHRSRLIAPPPPNRENDVDTLARARAQRKIRSFARPRPFIQTDFHARVLELRVQPCRYRRSIVVKHVQPSRAAPSRLKSPGPSDSGVLGRAHVIRVLQESGQSIGRQSIPFVWMVNVRPASRLPSRER